MTGVAWAQAPAPGTYAGVTPEGGEPPSPKAPPPGFQYVTWPGFRAGAGGSEVFLQLTGPVTYKEKRRGTRIYITMDKALVYLKNNLRPVITRNFKGTPVSRFRLRRLKKDRLRLEIKLRYRSKHSVATRSAGQYHYLIVSFPPPRSR
jgi:hypothetical protein